MSGTQAVRAATRLLAAAGIEARVESAGRDGEIAAVSARPGRLADVAQLAPAIRALGFRYVALELDAGSGAD